MPGGVGVPDGNHPGGPRLDRAHQLRLLAVRGLHRLYDYRCDHDFGPAHQSEFDQLVDHQLVDEHYEADNDDELDYDEFDDHYDGRHYHYWVDHYDDRVDDDHDAPDHDHELHDEHDGAGDDDEHDGTDNDHELDDHDATDNDYELHDDHELDYHELDHEFHDDHDRRDFDERDNHLDDWHLDDWPWGWRHRPDDRYHLWPDHDRRRRAYDGDHQGAHVGKAGATLENLDHDVWKHHDDHGLHGFHNQHDNVTPRLWDRLPPREAAWRALARLRELRALDLASGLRRHADAMCPGARTKT